jgi:transposase InsO family protein
LIVAFIDEMRAEGHAVESVCRVLRSQDCQIAARTYRAWRQQGRPVAARTVTDAQVENTVRDLAWTIDDDGTRRLTPEGLYGRRKMVPLVRRQLPEATPGAVDRAMRSLGLQGVRCSKGIRTTIPAKDGRRAGDLLDRDFSAPAPNRTWVMDFTYVRAWTGFIYVAFIVDVFAQRIVAWNAASSKDTDLVMTPLRMAIWQRARDGHPIEPGELIGHADAGSQGGINRSSQHLEMEVVDEQTAGVDGDVDGEAGDAVSGESTDSPRDGEDLLGEDRRGTLDRGRCGRVRRVGARRDALVPRAWWDADHRAEPTGWPLSVVQ